MNNLQIDKVKKSDVWICSAGAGIPHSLPELGCDYVVQSVDQKNWDSVEMVEVLGW